MNREEQINLQEEKKEQDNTSKKWMYVNQAGVGFNLYEFNLELKNSQINDEIHISMSPQHAKSLVNILSVSIKAYEEQVGKIIIEAKEEV